MIYKINVPDELITVITDMGYDVNSWFLQQFIAPLQNRLTEKNMASDVQRIRTREEAITNKIIKQVRFTEKAETVADNNTADVQ